MLTGNRMQETKRLIINGDDFGISRGVNEAIVRAFKDGVLTGCSLMAAGEAFEQAVELARENEGLAVGLHLVTVMGRAVLPPSEIPDLVDGRGVFPSNPTAVGLKIHFSPVVRRQLRKELDAQFRRFLSTGLPMAHVDSHLHMHVHPFVFETAVELAERYGVRRMRVPRDDLELALRFDGSALLEKASQAFIFRQLTRRMHRRLTRCGFAFPDRVFGHFQSGRMSKAYVLHILKSLGPGTFEIYFHPGLCPEPPAGIEKEKGCSRGMQRELEVLVDPEVADALRRLGIRAINYFDLDGRS